MLSFQRRSEAEFDVSTGYKILYEDEWFLAVDKPAPLPVHPGGRFLTKNLLSFLQRDLKLHLHIVNRLDSETSGIVLAAKNAEAAGRLGLEFERRRVEKYYAAVLLGRWTKPDGRIDLPLGFLRRDRFRMRCADAAGESAETAYEKSGEIERDGEIFTPMRVRPRTGRMHQIRAHFALCGHPVAGDKIYIEPSIYSRYIESGWQEDMLSVVKARRLMLHAARLVFKHPVHGETMDIQSPVPEDFFTA